MTIFRRDDFGSKAQDYADSAKDALSDGVDQVQWYATTWFKSSASATGAVVLIILAGIFFFVCRPWSKSRKAEKYLANIKQQMILAAMEDPACQPLNGSQPGLSYQQGGYVPPPPLVPPRPGLNSIQSGLGNQPGVSNSGQSFLQSQKLARSASDRNASIGGRGQGMTQGRARGRSQGSRRPPDMFDDDASSMISGVSASQGQLGPSWGGRSGDAVLRPQNSRGLSLDARPPPPPQAGLGPPLGGTKRPMPSRAASSYQASSVGSGSSSGR